MVTEHYLVPNRSVAGGGRGVACPSRTADWAKKLNILNEKLDFLFSTDLTFFIPLEENIVNI